MRPFSGSATVSCRPWITSSGVAEPAFHQPLTGVARVAPICARAASGYQPSRHTLESLPAGRVERERHVGRALSRD